MRQHENSITLCLNGQDEPAAIYQVPRLHTPNWTFNGHIHTICSSLFGKTRKPPHKRIEIDTPDNDFLELDVIRFNNTNPVVVLFHGLEGSTSRYYMTELMNALYTFKYSVIAVNFRSCGSRLNRQKRFYHSGETKDPLTVFRWAQKQFPGRKLFAAGFSLGSNVLLKSLGELGFGHPVDAAVGISTPYDLKEGSHALSHGFNQVYDKLFVFTLAQKARAKRKKYPDIPKFEGTTLYEFDNQITSKIHGFKDAEDYYKQCSSRHFIQDIKKPTLLIHSRQDPLCPYHSIPLHKIENNNYTDIIVTNEGGHVGFWSKPYGWLNRSIVNFFNRLVNIH